jgi:hypothetical protein
MFQYRKRIFLVNRDLQFRYAKSAGVAGVISSILTATVLLYPLFVFKILVIPKFLPAPILVSMLLAVLLNIILISGFSLFLTHRLAGPVYGLLREFRRITAGFFGHEMRVRKEDELKYLIRNFNEASVALKEMTELDIISIDNVVQSLEAGESPELAKEDLMAIAKRLRARITWTEKEGLDD